MEIRNRYLVHILVLLLLFTIGCKTIYGFGAKDVFVDKDQIRFIDLIKKGKYTEAEGMIKNGLDINFKNEQGITPLYYFYMKKDFKSFKKMLELGANPNVDPEGLGMYYLLDMTMSTKEDRYFKLLLEYNVDINYAPPTINGTKMGTSPLEFSLSYDTDIKYLKMLIEHKINPYYSDHPLHSPIYDALTIREYKRVILLLDYYPGYLSDEKNIITTKGEKRTLKDIIVKHLEEYNQAPGSQLLKDQRALVKYLKERFDIDVKLQYPNGR